MSREIKSPSDFSKCFTQGFICAVCILIQFYDCVTTEVLELWKSGGLKTIEDLDNYGIDIHDKEIIIKHKKELFS